MYSEQTYEVLIKRILDNIQNDLDKREGSVTFNLIAPLTEELAKAYIEMDDILNLAFIEDNFDEYLDKRVNEFGLYRKEGEKATGSIKVTGDEGTSIDNSTIVVSDGLEFIVINDISLVSEDDAIEDEDANIIYVQALDVGYKYNLPKNSVFEFKENIDGITSMINEKAFENGVDLETDEELRERFNFYIKNPRTSGNKYHYEQWALECTGVGKVKVYPLWAGNGTVKILIIGNDNLPCTTEKINEVKSYIEEQRPIGATITVTTPELLELDITIKIDLNSSYSLDEAKALITEKLKEYINNLDEEDKITYVKAYSSVGDLECVDDISEFKINNSTSNIIITDDKIPILKTLTLTALEETT